MIKNPLQSALLQSVASSNSNIIEETKNPWLVGKCMVTGRTHGNKTTVSVAIND